MKKRKVSWRKKNAIIALIKVWAAYQNLKENPSFKKLCQLLKYIARILFATLVKILFDKIFK
ncbi:MAG: hypothetical protein FWD48_10365 [Oscillospiraceae bacterium]|nr:hypothetical protein [Oscillospiraceae bacterium]